MLSACYFPAWQDEHVTNVIHFWRALLDLFEGSWPQCSVHAGCLKQSFEFILHQPDVPVRETDVPAATICICSMSTCLQYMSTVFVALFGYLQCKLKRVFADPKHTIAANFGRAPACITGVARPRNEVPCIMSSIIAGCKRVACHVFHSCGCA